LCTAGQQGEAPEEDLAWFPESGYAIVRNDWNTRPLSEQLFLFLNGAFHSQAHRHADDLSILWYDRGRPILVDSGKYSYNRDSWRDYVRSTRAHNTVEIDGEDYSIRRKDAYGSALKGYQRFGNAFLLVAETRHAHVGVNHKRVVG